jgi:hypothetical protein
MILNDYHDLSKWDGLVKASAYFLIIYFQAQLHRLILVPILLEKRSKRYLLFSSGFIAIGTLVLYYADYYWIYADDYSSSCDEETSTFTGLYSVHSTVGILLAHLVYNVVDIFIVMCPFLIWDYYAQQQRKNIDKILINDIQIKLLHSQLNPHFFFNVLNNLYGMSLHEPDRMPSLIIQLSKLMRYQIESSELQTVSLSDEVDFLHSYISLEKERIGNRCKIVVKLPEAPVSNKYTIAPLLLMPLVENAFKHGLGLMNDCHIFISLQVENGELFLLITNSISENKIENSTGVGLDNTKKRLNLLYKDFELKTGVNSRNEFEALLRIRLNSYLK